MNANLSYTVSEGRRLHVCLIYCHWRSCYIFHNPQKTLKKVEMYYVISHPTDIKYESIEPRVRGITNMFLPTSLVKKS